MWPCTISFCFYSSFCRWSGTSTVPEWFVHRTTSFRPFQEQLAAIAAGPACQRFSAPSWLRRTRARSEAKLRLWAAAVYTKQIHTEAPGRRNVRSAACNAPDRCMGQPEARSAACEMSVKAPADVSGSTTQCKAKRCLESQACSMSVKAEAPGQTEARSAACSMSVKTDPLSRPSRSRRCKRVRQPQVHGPTPSCASEMFFLASRACSLPAAGTAGPISVSPQKCRARAAEPTNSAVAPEPICTATEPICTATPPSLPYASALGPPAVFLCLCLSASAILRA